MAFQLFIARILQAKLQNTLMVWLMKIKLILILNSDYCCK